MSLIIHKENQTLLWNTANNNKNIGTFFQYIQPVEQHNWFQNIISMFYNKYKFTTITINELSQINKEILRYMIKDASEYLQPQVQKQEQGEMNEYKKESKHESYINDFNDRQQEYEQMNKKEPPKQIDFTEQNSDTNLNMNELLERQKEQRNLDLRVFPQTEKQKPKIKIEKEMGLIKNDITDLSYLNEGKNMELEEINSYKHTIINLQKEVEEIKKLLKNKTE